VSLSHKRPVVWGFFPSHVFLLSLLSSPKLESNSCTLFTCPPRPHFCLFRAPLHILSPGSHKRIAERQRKNHKLCINHSNNNNHLETGQQALLCINEWHTAVTQPSTNPSDTHPPSRTSTQAKKTQNTRLTSQPCLLALDLSHTAQVGYGASCPTDSGS
jgi:hypothetical protein